MPGCLTYDGSIGDALADVHEAIAGCVGSLNADGKKFPAEMQPTIAATIVVALDAA